jgi:DNA-binding LacI/PurR family transcriptional regulator
MTSTPKQHRYLDIADSLRTQIRSGQWEVGDRLPSFVEMYREHGATPATMQRVYDLLEKEELVERRSRSGVYVTASKCPPPRSGLLSIVLPHVSDAALSYMDSSYAMRLLRGMHAEANLRGFQITLGTIEQILTSPHPADGLLLQGVNSIEQHAHLKEPIVSLFTHLPMFSSVGIDDFESSKKLTEYLLGLGHRRIAALLDSERDWISPLRVQGYQAALTENDIEYLPDWHRKLSEENKGEYPQWGYDEMCRWLREGWANLKCTALITQNDAVAVGAIKALRHHGYRVPQDVSVVGFDNAGNDWHFDLKLTSVQIPLEEIGREAIAMLSQRIEQPGTAIQTTKFPTKIIEGESTTRI